MWKAMTIVAALMSLTACVLVLKVQHEREETIRRAIKQHEAQIVQRYMPLLREMAARHGVTTVTLDPQTVAELIGALAEIARHSAEAAEQARRAATSTETREDDRDALHASGGDAGARSVRPASASDRTSRSEGAIDSGRRTAARSAPDAPAPREPGRMLSSRLDLSLPLEGEIILADRETGALRRLRLPSGDLERLPGNFGNTAHPAWSPEGDRFAYVSDVDGQDDIYVFDVHSRRTTKITNTAAREASLAWSSDGQRIAFISDGEEEAGVRILSLESPDETFSLSHAGEALAWSPDGKHIAYLRSGMDLRLSPPDGQEMTILLRYPEEQRRVLAKPMWLADNKTVLVTRWTVVGSEPNRTLDSELLAIDIATADVRPLPMPQGFTQALCCSPDGKYVLAIGVENDERFSRFYAVSVDSGRYRPVATSTSAFHDASWSAGPVKTPASDDKTVAQK